MKYAIQLYTIRDRITDEATLVDSLQQLKAMGYDGVEFAGYYGIEPERIREILKETGMVGIGSHTGIDPLEHDLDGVLRAAAEIGLQRVSMSWSACDSKQEVEHTLRVLNTACKQAEAMGIEILYHNHSHELRKVDGCQELPLDEIKRQVPLEIDLYWVFYAGFDPVEYMNQNRNQIGLVHIKDGKKEEAAPCALGEGENNVAGICAAAEELGIEWLIVENDTPQPDGLQDARRSMEWLKKANR